MPCLFFPPILTEIIFLKTANTKSYKTTSKPRCSIRKDGQTNRYDKYKSLFAKLQTCTVVDKHRIEGCELDLSGSGYGKLASCCDDGNDH